MGISENASLRDLNTFGIDVKTRFLITIESVDDLDDLFTRDLLLDYPHLILGGGSNVLFTCDYSGVVILIRTKGLQLLDGSGVYPSLSNSPHHSNLVYVKVQAGESWDGLVSYCVHNDWGGLENLSHIPGQVGTSPLQNIGAYGVELKDSFYSLEAFEKKTGYIRVFDKTACQFGYRDSIFKNAGKDKYVITSVTFCLTSSGHRICTDYQALNQELDSVQHKNIDLAQVREAVIRIRERKLPNPALIGNAGSFFKNPVITKTHYEAIKLDYPDIIAFHEEKGLKVAAGWLIEKAGWKGYRMGDAGVHQKQALVLVNHGKAAGQDILHLAESISESVLKLFKIKLEPEVNIIGNKL